MMTQKKETFLVLGNGPAGHFAIGEIRKANPEAEIIITSKEPIRTYLRTQLAECIESDLPDDKFFMVKEDWYEKNNIKQLLSKEAIEIHPEEKAVMFNDGDKIAYDKLIIATGSYNFIPPVDIEVLKSTEIVDVNKLDSNNYRNIEGIYSIRELSDILLLREKVKESKKAVVIGGGLLGLEAAWKLKQAGLDVSVVEFFKRLLPKQLDEEAAVIFKEIADKSGIELILGDSAETVNIEEDDDGNRKLKSLKLKNGDLIPCDILLFSVGVRSKLRIASEAGIETDKGIKVNRRMETNLKDIYACGDVVEIDGFAYGTWPAALTMGRVAGTNAAGGEMEFPSMVLSTIFNGLNAKVFSAGSIDFADNSLDVYSYKCKDKGFYKKLFFKDDHLVAGILIGDTSKSTRIMKGIEKGYSKQETFTNDIL